MSCLASADPARRRLFQDGVGFLESYILEVFAITAMMVISGITLSDRARAFMAVQVGHRFLLRRNGDQIGLLHRLLANDDNQSRHHPFSAVILLFEDIFPTRDHDGT